MRRTVACLMMGRPVSHAFGVPSPGVLQMDPDTSCVHSVQGDPLEGAAVFPEFLSAKEEQRLATEVQVFLESPHALSWGQYRTKHKRALRHYVNFFGKHTHSGLAHISNVKDTKNYINTIAVIHAPAHLAMCAKLHQAGVMQVPPTAFRMNEYPEVDSGHLPETPPVWQGKSFVVLSLESDTVLEFTKFKGGKKSEAAVFLPRRSAALFTGGAASEWRHCVPCEEAVDFPPLQRRIRKNYRLSSVFYTMDIESVNVSDA